MGLKGKVQSATLPVGESGPQPSVARPFQDQTPAFGSACAQGSHRTVLCTGSVL